MEHQEQMQSPEQRDNTEFLVLWNKVQELLENPLTVEEVIEHDQRLDQTIMLGQIGRGTERCSGIIIPDFATLRLILEHLSLDQETIDELIAHEERHYNAALTTVAVPTLRLRIMKERDNSLSLQPATALSFPDGLDQQTVKSILRAVVNAPVRLSQGDLAHKNLFDI